MISVQAISQWLAGLSGSLAVVLSIVFFSGAAHPAAETALPMRAGPPVQTTPGVPHVQIGVQVVPELSAEILRRVSQLPGLDIRPTVIGMWGAKGFWVLEDLALARPDAIYRGREFAHLHEDGSLHASLPPDCARQAVAAGWATHHPSAQYHARLAGFVMLHTPRTAQEVYVIFGLIVDGYNFVTGQDVQASSCRERRD